MKALKIIAKGSANKQMLAIRKLIEKERASFC